MTFRTKRAWRGICHLNCLIIQLNQEARVENDT